MSVKVLAIGDLANNVSTIKKFTKTSEIHLVNFNWKGNSTVMDEREGIEFQHRVRDFYLNLQQKEPERVILIDGHKSIDDIHSEIWSVVNERLL